MTIMVKCSFCGTNIEPGTGKMFVKKDGKILYFCSRKCEKNLLVLKRKPRDTRWTAEAAAVKEGSKQ
ncbi:50S ribosomal protein L24e [Candidatus Woesearchaeota archaeon]|nr:MAG: 50S ribosomal protein L24e [Candidatus Woesearchaeota archaeon]